MNARLPICVAAVASFSSDLASADGGWHSGGGVLSSVEGNPWFVRPTAETVTYCFEMDKENFGASEQVARASLQKALDYWKNELADNAKELLRFSKGKPQIIVGADSFVEASCDSKVDLRLQFGLLSKDQASRFENPRVHVGAAIRTEYNRETLKGRGFVYISPERGLLALERENLVPNRWSAGNGRLLELTLIHELGHVFGVPHVGKGIMGSEFADSLLGSSLEYYASSRVTPSPFRAFSDGKTSWCRSGKGATQCGRFSYKIRHYDSSLGTRIEFVDEHSDSPTAPLQAVVMGSGSLVSSQLENSVRMWLPKEQRVLPEYTGRERSILAFWGDFSHVYVGEARDVNDAVLGSFVLNIDLDGLSVLGIPCKSCSFWPFSSSENERRRRYWPIMLETSYYHFDSVTRRSEK